jgi:hypothetical protein
MTTSNKENEELRSLVYDALTYVQDKDFFARKGTIIPSTKQVEATMQLINSEVRQALDRLEEKYGAAIDYSLSPDPFKFVALSDVKAERQRYE